jgi:hypothetical protein
MEVTMNHITASLVPDGQDKMRPHFVCCGVLNGPYWSSEAEGSKTYSVTCDGCGAHARFIHVFDGVDELGERVEEM